MDRECRRHPRSTAEADAAIRCTNAEFPARGADPHNLAEKLLNTSAQGALIVSTGRLRQGIRLEVEINLPSRNLRFTTGAVVRWSVTLQSKVLETDLAGLEFEKVIAALSPPAAPGAGREPAPAPSRDPRRRHKRFKPEGSQIVCLPGGFRRALGLSANVSWRIRDVSAGGAGIFSSQELPPGRRVEVRLSFQRPRASSVMATGEVRWCRRDTLSAEPRWMAGIQFTQVSLDDEGCLLEVGKFFLGERGTEPG